MWNCCPVLLESQSLSAAHRAFSAAMMWGSDIGQLSATPRKIVASPMARSVAGFGRRLVLKLCQATKAQLAATRPSASRVAQE